MDDAAAVLKNVEWRPRSGEFCFGPVSSKAHRGRFIALVGPNGAGKSTLLKLLGGLWSPSMGEVSVAGRSPRNSNPRERGRLLSVLSQEPERPFGFTVSEYVALGRFAHVGAFRHFGSKDRAIIAREIDIWGLQALAQRSVRTLSGGEFQRVRLARALVQEPGLLLLDEPGNHLDLTSRMAILERLESEAHSGMRCVMAVLHDINDALLYADEVWLFSSGRLIASGDPQRVLNPKTLAQIYGLNLDVFKNQEGLSMLGVPSGAL